MGVNGWCVHVEFMDLDIHLVVSSQIFNVSQWNWTKLKFNIHSASDTQKNPAKTRVSMKTPFSSSSPGGMNMGSTAAILGGVLAGVVLLGIIICCCCRKKNKNEDDFEE